ncbi:hypothetical protein COP2_017502 [Malus domestica]
MMNNDGLLAKTLYDDLADQSHGGEGDLWSANKDWEVCEQSNDFGWIQIAEPVTKLYTEATDGSSIETKESAFVGHHRDGDLGFGSSQAEELLDHLESVLANEPVC